MCAHWKSSCVAGLGRPPWPCRPLQCPGGLRLTFKACSGRAAGMPTEAPRRGQGGRQGQGSGPGSAGACCVARGRTLLPSGFQPLHLSGAWVASRLLVPLQLSPRLEKGWDAEPRRWVGAANEGQEKATWEVLWITRCPPTQFICPHPQRDRIWKWGHWEAAGVS